MKLYWASTEYSYMAEEEQKSNVIGGFVYSFMVAADVQKAQGKLVDALLSLNLTLVAIEFIELYEDISWESVEENIRYDGLAQEARETGKVIFDDFYAYESKD